MNQIVILTDENGPDHLFISLVRDLFPECSIQIVNASGEVFEDETSHLSEPPFPCQPRKDTVS